MEMDALQPEPCELLDLLQDIIAPFAEHFTSRFIQSKKVDHRAATGSVDGKVGWLQLNTHLRELFVFLMFHDEQESPISQELFIAMHKVARSLESTIHASRIRQVIKTAKLPDIVVSRISIKHKIY